MVSLLDQSGRNCRPPAAPPACRCLRRAHQKKSPTVWPWAIGWVNSLDRRDRVAWVCVVGLLRGMTTVLGPAIEGDGRPVRRVSIGRFHHHQSMEGQAVRSMHPHSVHRSAARQITACGCVEARGEVQRGPAVVVRSESRSSSAQAAVAACARFSCAPTGAR